MTLGAGGVRGGGSCRFSRRGTAGSSVAPHASITSSMICQPMWNHDLTIQRAFGHQAQ